MDITIRSYRTELEKRHDFTGRVWLTLAPAFLGMTLVVVPVLIRSLQVPRNLLNLAPFLVLLAIWFAIFIPKRKRDQQKLEQEIERLRAFERSIGLDAQPVCYKENCHLKRRLSGGGPC